MTTPPQARIFPFPANTSANPSGREVELKFALAVEGITDLRQALADLGGDVVHQSQRSTYYDTDDEALRRAGFSLRLREVDGRRVQTLKQDEGNRFDRGEWETAVTEHEPDLEAEGLAPVRALVARSGPLRPVFSNRIERLQQTIRLPDAVVEIALDEGETEAGVRRAPVLELELELKSGAPAALFTLARQLGAATPLRLSFATKAERGYQLRADAAPSAVKQARPRLSQTMMTGQALVAVVQACLAQIVVNDAILRARRRPEALHQLRVGLRRLRSALSLFKEVAADPRLEAVKSEARWLTKALDEARNLDAFIDGAYQPGAKALAGSEGMAAFGKRLLQVRTRAYDRVLKVLASRRAAEFPLMTVEWLAAGAWRDDPALAHRRDEPIALFAASALERLRRKLKRQSRGLKTMEAEARHGARITAKKLRYGLEFFTPLYPPPQVKRIAEPLKALQESLGALNDIAVGQRTAAEAVRGLKTDATDLAVVGGMLVGRLAPDATRLLDGASGQRKALLAAPRPWRI